MNKVLHLFSFNIGWSLCVWAAVAQWPLFSWMVGLGLVIVNIAVQPRRRIAIGKVLTVIALGSLMELFNLQLGLYTFPKDPSWHPPAWLFAFWPVFSLMFIDFIEGISRKPLWIHFIIGVIGGAGYYCGEWIGLITFREPKMISLALFSTIWAIEYILLMKATVAVGKFSFLQD